MNMFARFDENSAMTLQDIKETKQYNHHKQSLGGGGGGITYKVCGGYNKLTHESWDFSHLNCMKFGIKHLSQ